METIVSILLGLLVFVGGAILIVGLSFMLTIGLLGTIEWVSDLLEQYKERRSR